MQNEEKQKEPKAENHKQKTKRKKKGKVAEVYSLHQKGSRVKQIAQKMKLNARAASFFTLTLLSPESKNVAKTAPFLTVYIIRASPG